jgi:hypothetical protein
MPVMDAYAILSGLSALSRVFRILPVFTRIIYMPKNLVMSSKKGFDLGTRGDIKVKREGLHEMAEGFCFKPAFRRILNKKYDLSRHFFLLMPILNYLCLTPQGHIFGFLADDAGFLHGRNMLR